LHSVPKDEQPGSDSSRTSIVSTLGMSKEVASMLYVNLNDRQEFPLNNNFEELIKLADYLWGHSFSISVSIGSALGLAYLPHITE